MKCLFVIILFAIQFQVVSQVFMPVSVKHNLRNNAGEVAREGCMFSYTEIENYDYLFFGFKGNNKALAGLTPIYLVKFFQFIRQAAQFRLFPNIYNTRNLIFR